MVDVVPVRYDPHDDAYELDIELLDAAELRARVASDPHRGFERVDFQCFLFVRSGSYTHIVDFETYSLTAGSCLVISPGQVHRFGARSRWSGWMLIVNGHLVSDDTRDLPTHVVSTTSPPTQSTSCWRESGPTRGSRWTASCVSTCSHSRPQCSSGA